MCLPSISPCPMQSCSSLNLFLCMQLQLSIESDTCLLEHWGKSKEELTCTFRNKRTQMVFSRGYMNYPITLRWACCFQQENPLRWGKGSKQHHFSRKKWGSVRWWFRDARILRRFPGKSWFFTTWPKGLTLHRTFPDNLSQAMPVKDGSWTVPVQLTGQASIPLVPKNLKIWNQTDLVSNPGSLIYNFGNFNYSNSLRLQWMEMATLLGSFGAQMRWLMETKFRQMAEFKDW